MGEKVGVDTPAAGGGVGEARFFIMYLPKVARSHDEQVVLPPAHGYLGLPAERSRGPADINGA